MNATQCLAAPRSDTALSLDVVAFGTAAASPDMIPVLRRSPGPAFGEPLPPAFLKHSADQTIVGLSAVLDAIHRHNLGSASFADWGVLGASTYLGRLALVGVLTRYAADGAWGVSPHVIPHCTLHSVSGTLSLVLKSHGPNMGVGGGPGAAAEALLAAATLLSDNRLAGVWVVLTGWDPEPVPPAASTTPASHDVRVVPMCHAVTLALVAARPAHEGLRLRAALSATGGRADCTGEPSDEDLFTAKSLLLALESPDFLHQRTAWRLGGGGRVELEHLGIGAEDIS